MLGKKVSHYKILEKLGEGGMGVVYKAEDTSLKRTVALKFLNSQALGSGEERTRFITEARAAAALSHPHVATIYEIDEVDGETFIVMEYIEGQSLRQKVESGPLRLSQALDIAIQVAEGLQEAHERGIVHRDVKSGNIMMTSRGRAKISDFGLAKMGKGAVITREGTTLGTVAYMSPEQARGEQVDQRTDIWSLGVVLYEMVIGRRPFKGDYEQAVVYSILNEEPDPITGLRTGIPMELERIVGKALAKSPEQRYQHVDELMVDLRRLRTQSATPAALSSRTLFQIPQKKRSRSILLAGIFVLAAVAIAVSFFLLSPTRTPLTPGVEMAPARGWINSIAVLPFRDFSPSKDQEYFCDGMTEAIIGKLTGLKDLKVISMTSVMSFRTPDRDIKEIGKQLGVATILEGSVQKEENRIRVSAQLVNPADDAHLWSETYDRELESVFAIQDEISQAIVEVLKIRLLGEERTAFAKRYTENLEAYKAYSQGRFLWNKRTEEHLMKAIEYFEKAIELDPNYALAYAGLADAYAVLPSNIGYPVEQALPKAKEAAQKALKLDDKLAEAHASLGLALVMEEDFEEAERQYLRAIQLNPGYGYAHYWYSLLLDRMSRTQEGLRELELAFELDPLSVVIVTNLASKKASSGDWVKAEELIRRALEIEPSRGVTYTVYGAGLRRLGLAEEAIQVYAKAIEIDQCCWDAYNALAYLHSYTGDFDQAIEVANKYVELAPSEPDAHDTRGDIYAHNGKLNQAIENYKKALEIDPAFINTWWKLTGMYLFKRDYAKAEDLIQRRASSKDKKVRSSASRRRAQMLMFQGKLKQALEVLDQGLAADRSSQIGIDERVKKRLTKIFIYFDKQSLDLALKEVESIREMLEDPVTQDPAKLRDLYAIVWGADGRVSEADEVLRAWREEIRENDPVQTSRYHRIFGTVELIKGNPKTAITHLRMGLTENSKPLFEALYPLGQAYVESGQADEAAAILEKVLLSHDERRLEYPIFSVKAHYLLGLAYQQLGQNKEAIEQYQEFLDIWKDADPGISEIEDAKTRLKKLTVENQG